MLLVPLLVLQKRHVRGLGSTLILGPYEKRRNSLVERGILVASKVPTYGVLRVLPCVLEWVSKERVLYRKDKRCFHFLA